MEEKLNKYSVERFINDDLNITVNRFATITGYSQSRIANWISRKPKTVNDLPVSILKLLSEQSNLSMDDVYKKLIKYELENKTTTSK